MSDFEWLRRRAEAEQRVVGLDVCEDVGDAGERVEGEYEGGHSGGYDAGVEGEEEVWVVEDDEGFVPV